MATVSADNSSLHGRLRGVRAQWLAWSGRRVDGGLVLKGKGKVGRAPPERRRGAHLPFKAIEPVGG